MIGLVWFLDLSSVRPHDLNRVTFSIFFEPYQNNYFLRSEKKADTIFFGFVYAKNDLILSSFIFRETAHLLSVLFYDIFQSLKMS